MIEVVCPMCRHGLQVPPEAMGTNGTCRHCESRIALPTMWRYRLDLAWRATWPVICWCVAAPFTFVNHLFSRPNEFAGLSQTERLLVLEARKQTKIQRSNRSDTTCCLGCIIILLLLGVTGLLGPLLAIIGIGGAIGASQ